MRGLDTNVLVRFITADEAIQSEAARLTIEAAEISGERLHVSLLVLVELVWVLRGGRYGFPCSAVADALDAILEADVFVVQDRDLVRNAIGSFRQGPADFSDYLIGEIDRRAGCLSTLTFDRRLALADGFEEVDLGGSGPLRVSEP